MNLLFIFASTFAAAAVQTNLKYDPSEPASCSACSSCRCLDLHLPVTENIVPVIVLAHGGLWYSGDKSDFNEVCANIVTMSNSTIGCATANYRYSQYLGGCCFGDCLPTFESQVAELDLARSFVSSRPGVDSNRLFVGGHSAGGHLAAVRALRTSAQDALGYVGIEGIYNVTQWDKYQKSRWSGGFSCPTWQAFGFPSTCPGCFDQGSPTFLAADGATLSAPLMLIHSPEDDWVQSAQATDLYNALPSPPSGSNVLDVAGKCVRGQHPDTLTGRSAETLAGCIIEFINNNIHPTTSSTTTTTTTATTTSTASSTTTTSTTTASSSTTTGSGSTTTPSSTATGGSTSTTTSTSSAAYHAPHSIASISLLVVVVVHAHF